MTTTIVRDSIVGDAWIQQTAAAVPIQPCLGEDGQPNGDWLTGPVRLSWPDLFQLPPATDKNQNPKYGAMLMFTPLADFTPLYQLYNQKCGEWFPEHYDAGTGQYLGLKSPFRDQAEKVRHGGATPGAVFMTCNSKFKPSVVDMNNNPIVDESKVYPGVWAICSINAWKNTHAANKGVRFGLQSVMLIGDDTPLGGGAPDTGKTFGGVRGAISAPALTAPPAMPGGAQPPAGTPAFVPPAGGTASAPFGAPAVPGTAYAPAAGAGMAQNATGYVPPAAPAPAPTPAAPATSAPAPAVSMADLL